ncbi:MAG TPA: acyl-CoA dehydrogenase family protein [Steroidobacteraceae bacterium]|nr:acyl-CoA dehydrogenase family protein [Steroidobacteraceae bacterium]
MEAQRTAAGSARVADGGSLDLRSRARAAFAVAEVHAAAVDAQARFPTEAFAEIRKNRLLGVMVPEALGGEGASIAEIVDVCYLIGQACGSAGLIYAMHQIKMACIVRHLHGNSALERILQRVVAEQLLLASSTTEGQGGGNVRSSEAAIVREGDHVTLAREATVISYGIQADGLVTTARRAADAPSGDQVLLVLLKSDYTLQRLQSWDTLGMRGTCSEGFTLRARARAEQLIAEPYEKIHAQTMVPCAHLMWGAVWMGIAAAAMGKAQAFIRNAVRQSSGRMPPGAAQYTQALSSLHTLRSVLASALQAYEAAMADDRILAGLEFQSMITLAKVQASELATATVLGAMRACGLSGYRNDSDFTIGRHLRDVLSGLLMINNERILANLVTPSLLTPLPSTVGD